MDNEDWRSKLTGFYDKYGEGIRRNILKLQPISSLGNDLGALNTLINYQQEMKSQNISGADNYYHRLAMCENAQKGRAYTSLLGGLGKEGIDMLRKSNQFWGKMEPTEVWEDSRKDMANNVEGIALGMAHPNTDCRTLLEDLDWKTNTWKR